MESKIKCLIRDKNLFIRVDIFGHTSKGIPGVEIVGLGAQGRCIKEKFTQISRELKMRIPPLKYTLCVEINECYKLSKDDLSYVELPLLIIFWSLASQIPIKNLSDCLAYGKVSVDRDIFIPEWVIPSYLSYKKNMVKIISLSQFPIEEGQIKIPVEDLFHTVGGFRFVQGPCVISS